MEQSWIKRKIAQIIASALAANGAFIAGTNIGWSAQSQHRLVSDKEYDFDVSDNQFSWISALLPLGAAFGGLGAGFVFNRIGRKWAILLFYIPFLVGWLLMIWAVAVEMMYAGRLILGFCSGAFTAVVPVYICEVAEKDIRGMLAGFQQFLIVIGIAVAYLVGALTKVFTTNIILCIVPVIFAIPFIFVPETPQYLITHGKKEKAIRAMKWLYGKNFDAEKMANDLLAQNEENDSSTIIDGLKELRKFEAWYALVIAVGLQIFQQLSGINAVIFYSTRIFQNASTNFSPIYATAIMGVIQIVATFISIGVVDKLGRKILLTVSGVAMSLCTGILGVYFFLMNHHKALPAWVPIFAVCLYLLAFSLGFGPVPWILLGEIFSTKSKDLACAIAVFTNWILAFAVTKSYTHFVDWIGAAGTFLLFTVITIVGVVFVIFIVVETKGLTLKEVQEKIASRRGDTT